ncbi:DUF3168 domain-containing protein [Xanthobacteraceae bacterium A53D]
MTSPTLELQGALAVRLKADPSVSAIIGVRVYDAVPRQTNGTVATAEFPYVSFGPFDLLRDDADCIDGSEITVQLDCWSRQPGFPQVHRLADAVVEAIEAADIELTDNAAVLIEHSSTRVFRDPDGITSHAVVTLTAVIETP